MTIVLLSLALVALCTWMAASIALGVLWARERARADRAASTLHMLGWSA